MNWGYVPWPCEKYLDDALEILSAVATEEEKKQILSDLEESRAQLWVAVDDRLIAALITCRDGDTLEMWKCAGPILPFVLDYLDFIQSSAQGIKQFRLGGRKGWTRFLKKAGWKEDGEFMVKDII